jgi:hypothetical protein
MEIGTEVATEQQAADVVGITRQALEQRRRRGTAPPHKKIGRTIIYLWRDVDEYLAKRPA